MFYVSEHLLNSFEYYCGVSDFSEWIKENVYSDFGISLTSPEMIKTLEGKVRDSLYENIGEWIKEKMRKTILTSKKYITETTEKY